MELTEKGLTGFLGSLCCNRCIFFKDKECTEEGSVEHTKEKLELKQAYAKLFVDQWKATPPPVSEAREKMINNFKTLSDNIDTVFCCTKIKNK